MKPRPVPPIPTTQALLASTLQLYAVTAAHYADDLSLLLWSANHTQELRALFDRFLGLVIDIDEHMPLPLLIAEHAPYIRAIRQQCPSIHLLLSRLKHQAARLKDLAADVYGKDAHITRSAVEAYETVDSLCSYYRLSNYETRQRRLA
ncbi:MAG: hypothetical protein AAFV53_00410 [Myxococcota bacterium]